VWLCTVRLWCVANCSHPAGRSHGSSYSPNLARLGCGAAGAPGVTVGAPLVFLPPLTWTRTVVAMPSGDRLVWQDSEQIEREEGWVDTNFGIDSSGNALLLDINVSLNSTSLK